MSYPIKTESQMSAMLEANLDHVKEIFVIAKQHKIIYMTLNQSAFETIRPVIDYLIEQKRFEEAIKFLLKHTPDCVDRTLLINYIMDKEK